MRIILRSYREVWQDVEDAYADTAGMYGGAALDQVRQPLLERIRKYPIFWEKASR